MNSSCWNPMRTPASEQIAPRLAIPVPRLNAKVGQAKAAPPARSRRHSQRERSGPSREPIVSTYLMFSKAASSDALSTSVDMVGMGMKLTANATPMPAPFAIVDQTHQVQHDAAQTIFSEHKCHRTPFTLSTKRSSSPAHGVCLHHLLGQARTMPKAAGPQASA